MIIFKEKQYSEYEAMRALYNEIQRNDYLRRNCEIISRSQLVPVLKGNSVVIEKFVISTSLFGHDKYRMYIKIGAKAKLPDEVRLSGGSYYRDNAGFMSLKIKGGAPYPNNGGGQQQQGQTNFSDTRVSLSEKTFNDKKKNNGGGGKFIESSYEIRPQISLEIHKLLGEAIKYDKRARELILEFDSPCDACRALSILPFGLNYKVYLLDA